MNKTDNFFGMLMVCVAVLGILAIVVVVDEFYARPTASDNANIHCQGEGFDQYKSFSRVGIWSTEPVGIKCEYVEKYTDLGVRTS